MLQQGALREGRLDPEAPPKKPGNELLAACEKLKTAGIEPIGGGIQDGYWSEWYISHGLVQNLDTLGEAVQLFIGDKDFREPKYHEHWVKLQELRDKGYLTRTCPRLNSIRASIWWSPESWRSARR